MQGAVQHLLAPRPQVVENVLRGCRVGGHILGWSDLNMLDILLQIGDIDTKIVKCESKVKDVRLISPIQLRSVLRYSSNCCNVSK